MHILHASHKLACIVTKHMSVTIRRQLAFRAFGRSGADGQEIHADAFQVREFLCQIIAGARRNVNAFVLVNVLIGIAVFLHAGADQRKRYFG